MFALAVWRLSQSSISIIYRLVAGDHRTPGQKYFRDFCPDNRCQNVTGLQGSGISSPKSVRIAGFGQNLSGFSCRRLEIDDFKGVAYPGSYLQLSLPHRTFLSSDDRGNFLQHCHSFCCLGALEKICQFWGNLV